MTDGRIDCDALGPDVTALARGELAPAEAAPVRAHLASCPACAALLDDVARIRAAAAARLSPAPSAEGRARLTAALDAAVEAAAAEEAARGPVARLLEAGGRRYAESRGFRFLTWSVAIHAAAAVVLSIYLGLSPGGGDPGQRTSIEVANAPTLPEVYPGDLLRPPVPLAPNSIEIPSPFAREESWPSGEAFLRRPEAGLPHPDPEDFRASLRLYPGEEFRAFATGRFRPDVRARRLAQVYGAGIAPRVEEASERGVRWLAAAQEANGTWPSGSPGDPGPQRDRFRGGVTGVALQALLGDGRTALRPGAYAPTVKAALSALAGSQDAATGLLGGFARTVVDDRPMCNHAPALAALAEAYGLDYGFLDAKERERLAGILRRGVAATLAAQRPDGSFGYAPGARTGDASVTLLQVEALEAARRAGIEVDPAAFRRAGAYLRSLVGPDGRLGYRAAGDRAGDATLTAQALALGRALDFPDEMRERMLAAVLGEAPAASASDRVLFRSSLLEVLAAGGGDGTLSRAAAAARAALGSQGATGSFPAEKDRYAHAAGDALATARTIRGLTAPYRVAAP